ncbi:Kelch repeat-containing protein [Pyxidicoccus trucidator]|uniref:Kelch repeat-containing protein n=1 Tax=Pyxidicoccus trucidator TaxID=2709662 RepID=UPI0013DB5A1D|nr:kelch motif-containing protein [Pyxidicoccus trucidator]
MYRHLLWVGALLALFAGCANADGEQTGACEGDPTRCDAQAAESEDAGVPPHASAPDGGEPLPPVILRALESRALMKSGEQRTLLVVAEDPLCDVLRFSWSADVGVMSAEKTTAATSQATWTAPRCVPADVPSVVTATVTNDRGLSATTRFTPLGLPDCSTWAPTGSLVTARSGPTATLLPSGKVLVAGGVNRSSYLALVEEYDPETGTWASTGSLATARSSHTATLLRSGKVLVAGGYSHLGASGIGNLRTAEVYDPETGTWASTGSLATARARHTATLLPSGKVLVVGGYSDAHGNLGTAEVYDPETGTWAAAGSLATAREGHTATLLRSGKVLVAGGYGNANVFLGTAEVYDPETGGWTATSSLATARNNSTATLLPSGKVLVASGYGSANGNGWVGTAEVYDPETGTWAFTGSLALGRHRHSATLLASGKVLVVGGITAGTSGSPNTKANATAEVYDPETGIWVFTGSLAAARIHHTATLLPSGQVLVVGGTADTKEVELYTRQVAPQVSPVPEPSGEIIP